MQVKTEVCWVKPGMRDSEMTSRERYGVGAAS